MVLLPLRLAISTAASSAINACAKSPGYVAMQRSLPPSTACMRLNPLHRGAAGAGIALVAFAIGHIAKIGAARPLQYIAAETCHIPQLLAGRLRQRLSHDGIV